MKLSGLDDSKTILVTAGASGIGKSIAEAFLATGARVHVCDIDQTAIDDFLNKNSGSAATCTDVADPIAVGELFDEIAERYGNLGVLINNAGIAGETAGVEDADVDAWKRCIDVDLSGPFYCTRRATPLLKQVAGASILNVSSTAGLFGFPMRSAYAASKWALIGLTKTWAMELGPHNIRVNAICPGSVSGDRIEGVIERDAAARAMPAERVREVYLRQSSMRTFVDRDDIANTALFLASDLGRRISGQAIAVDGHTEGLSNWLD